MGGVGCRTVYCLNEFLRYDSLFSSVIIRSTVARDTSYRVVGLYLSTSEFILYELRYFEGVLCKSIENCIFTFSLKKK